MTQKQKELLFKDLCARLPYGVKVLTYKLDYFHNPSSIETLYEINEDGYISTVETDTLRPMGKPYLIPLSSMAEEQKVIYGDLCYDVIRSLPGDTQSKLNELADWLNKNHFDYRGLIPMDLAIDATNLNIY